MDTHRLYMFIKETNDLLGESTEGDGKKLYSLKEVQDVLGVMDIRINEAQEVIENTIGETCSRSVEEQEDVKSIHAKGLSFAKLIQDKLKASTVGVLKTLADR